MKRDKWLKIKMLKTFFGMPKFPVHRIKTYTNYHVHKLQMTSTPLDPLVIFWRKGNTVDSTIGAQVDHKICASTPLFSSEQDMVSNESVSKGNICRMETAVKFNRVKLSKSTGSKEIIMNQ